MDYVGDIISNVRRDTRNEDVPTATSILGISDFDFLRYVNYGQENLQGLISNTNPQTFEVNIEISIVVGQDTYTIPDRVHADTRIVNVQYSPTGQVRDYRDLKERGISYRISENSSDPFGYTRQNGGLVLSGTPQRASSKLRITYERQLDSLDIRRGQITAASGSVITVGTNPDESSSPYNLTNTRYVCVSTPDGVVQLYNGAVSSYNAGLNEITLSAAISTYLVSGYTVGSLVGSYVTLGKYSTTHSKLPDACQRYIELYCGMKAFGRDSSNDISIVKDELEIVLKQILNVYQMADKDEHTVQLSDPYLVINVDL